MDGNALETAKRFKRARKLLGARAGVARRIPAAFAGNAARVADLVEGVEVGHELGLVGAARVGARLVAGDVAVLEVASGASDACIIDQLMAGAMIGEGTSYPDLVQVEGLNAEEYGVGFRKGSDLAAKLDAFLDAKFKDGSLAELAVKYGIDTKLIAR